MTDSKAAFEGSLDERGNYKYGQLTTGDTIYEGYFRDNMPHGEGILMKNDDRQTLIHEGLFENGIPVQEQDVQEKAVFEGSLDERGNYKYGQLTTRDTIYEGDFRDNIPHGQGILMKNDGEQTLIHAGLFEDGISVIKNHYFSGVGTYNGQFYKNKYGKIIKHGYGEMKYDNGMVYKGQYENDKMNGEGKMYNIDEELVEEGTYKDSKLFNGNVLQKCIYKVSRVNDNECFVGELRNGRMYEGTIFYKYGIEFLFTGGNTDYGVIINHRDDTVYKGDVRSNVFFRYKEPHGQGETTYKNGIFTLHKGTYMNGKPNGYGKVFYASGDAFQGNFRNGFPILQPAAESYQLDHAFAAQPPRGGGTKQRKTKRKKSNRRKTKRSHRKRK